MQVPEVAQNTMLTVQRGHKALLWRNPHRRLNLGPPVQCQGLLGSGELPSCRRLPTYPQLLGQQGPSTIPHSHSGCTAAGASKSVFQGVGATFSFAPQEAQDGCCQRGAWGYQLLLLLRKRDRALQGLQETGHWGECEEGREVSRRDNPCC